MEVCTYFKCTKNIGRSPPSVIRLKINFNFIETVNLKDIPIGMFLHTLWFPLKFVIKEGHSLSTFTKLQGDKFVKFQSHTNYKLETQ